jgi:hypothetical protein
MDKRSDLPVGQNPLTSLRGALATKQSILAVPKEWIASLRSQ